MELEDAIKEAQTVTTTLTTSVNTVKGLVNKLKLDLKTYMKRIYSITKTLSIVIHIDFMIGKSIFSKVTQVIIILKSFIRKDMIGLKKGINLKKQQMQKVLVLIFHL